MVSLTFNIILILLEINIFQLRLFQPVFGDSCFSVHDYDGKNQNVVLM